MPEDIFAEVPEFLAAFQNIRENGFFESMDFKVGGEQLEGKVAHFYIRAVGCIPNNPDFMAIGCDEIIDPDRIINSCRALVKLRKVKSVQVKVETDEWPKWNRSGTEITGSKGRRTILSLSVQFKI